MPELKQYDGPVYYCHAIDSYIEEVYGRKYSTVQGYSGDDRLGHYTYFWVDSEQWKYDYDQSQLPEEIEAHAKWVAEMQEKYPHYREYEPEAISFEEWSKLDGWDAHNTCPIIDEMVWHLRNDGHDIPSEFLVLVDW